MLEGGLVYLLALFGVSGERALALGLAGRVVTTATMIPGFVLWRGLLSEPGAAGPRGVRTQARSFESRC